MPPIVRESLSRHLDKFRSERSSTEESYIYNAPYVFLQREVMDNIGSEEFRTLKRIAQNELRMNLMVDDELFMSVLDRLCLLEKEIEKLKKD